MLNNELSNPNNIAIIGASENQSKPGGKVIHNLLRGGFSGEIYAVNPKKVRVDGVQYVSRISDLPPVDLAIFSIPASLCLEAAEQLAKAGTRAFIIFSAGFGEAGEAGVYREKHLLKICSQYNITLIGPNCVGILNENYKGVFTTPVPEYHVDGCEMISSSGATAVFIMEAAIATGLKFSNIYSIGNATQTGVEEILEDMDQKFDPKSSPYVKLLYLEHIKNPFKFLKHSASLIKKGCRIAAIKSGYSEAGGRAASSHTGAMTTSDSLIRALFKKAGIVYCSGREELINVAGIWQINKNVGKNVAIITHAGGSAVMLSDVLSSNGMHVPSIPEDKSQELLKKLHPGSSVANPIDFLATGTAEQLGMIIDFCEKLENIDSMVVVFGSPGLFNVHDVYEVLDEKLGTCDKPIYPVLPSLINAGKEIKNFLEKGHVNFADEVVLGSALVNTAKVLPPAFGDTELAEMNYGTIRDIISEAKDGYLDTVAVRKLLEAAGIPMVKEMEAYSKNELDEIVPKMQFPVVAKVIGPVHKTDVGGVTLNINSIQFLKDEYERMMKIPSVKGILIQAMSQGNELFVGAIKKEPFGHLILCGLGGVFVEVIKDIAMGLVPLTQLEAVEMVRSLKAYEIIKGYRGQRGINEVAFIDIIIRLSSLVYIAPEIQEVDINPVMGNEDDLVAVDARIKVSKG